MPFKYRRTLYMAIFKLGNVKFELGDSDLD
jgi:hypothetical protein